MKIEEKEEETKIMKENVFEILKLVVISLNDKNKNNNNYV